MITTKMKLKVDLHVLCIDGGVLQRYFSMPKAKPSTETHDGASGLRSSSF